MSVINQMLKDLDKRKVNEGSSQQRNSAIGSQITKKSHVLLFSMAGVIMVVITLFSWRLYQENTLLKSQSDLSQQTQLTLTSTDDKPSQTLVAEQKNQEIKSIATTANKPQQLEKIELSDTSSKELSNATSSNAVAQPKVSSPENKLPIDDVDFKQIHNDNNTQAASSQTSQVKSTAVIDEEVNEVEQSLTKQGTVKEAPLTEQSTKPLPSLTISRVEITPQALAQQKYSKAEQAIAKNNISDAEQLLEDILLLVPEHQGARKQLAALWYGRRLYQPALNLLSQGIVLEPDNADYRLMQARIYIELDQQQKALDSLLGLAQTNNVEYQSLLATTAQKLKNFQLSVNAYKQLTLMQPNVGRWWLGLAVAYDSEGQFNEAAMTYRQAIGRGNLSESARQFSRQRLEQLGG